MMVEPDIEQMAMLLRQAMPEQEFVLIYCNSDGTGDCHFIASPEDGELSAVMCATAGIAYARGDHETVTVKTEGGLQ